MKMIYGRDEGRGRKDFSKGGGEGKVVKEEGKEGEDEGKIHVRDGMKRERRKGGKVKGKAATVK